MRSFHLSDWPIASDWRSVRKMTVSVVEPLLRLVGDEVTAATSIPKRVIDRTPTMVLVI